MSTEEEGLALAFIHKYLTRGSETITPLSDMRSEDIKEGDPFYEDLEKLCGETINDTCQGLLEGYFEDEEEDESIIGLVLRDKDRLTGIFIGEIDTGTPKVLQNAYSCAERGGMRGELLGYLGLLKYREDGGEATELFGTPAGGIPPIVKGDTESDEDRKTQALLNYHIKRGANIDKDGNFTYTLDQILKNIEEIRKKIGSYKRRKTKKKTKKKKKKKTKKNKKKKKKKKRMVIKTKKKV